MQDRLLLKSVVVSTAQSVRLRYGAAARQRGCVDEGQRETASETLDRSSTSAASRSSSGGGGGDEKESE